jgi:hypothetical protein
MRSAKGFERLPETEKAPAKAGALKGRWVSAYL